MNLKKYIQKIIKFSFIDHLFEFVYWLLVIIGLVLLGQFYNFDSLWIYILLIIAYSLVCVFFYFFLLSKLKSIFTHRS